MSGGVRRRLAGAPQGVGAKEAPGPPGGPEASLEGSAATPGGNRHPRSAGNGIVGDGKLLVAIDQ